MKRRLKMDPRNRRRRQLRRQQCEAHTIATLCDPWAAFWGRPKRRKP